MSRPEKLTMERLLKITSVLKVGGSLKAAAVYAGISKRTIFEWLRRGRFARSGKYCHFHLECNRAIAVGELVLLSIIRAAAERGQWQAAAWRLERRHPKQWACRVVIGN